MTIDTTLLQNLSGIQVIAHRLVTAEAPVRRHKKRRNQSENYHARVQKKWTKRFGKKRVPGAGGWADQADTGRNVASVAQNIEGVEGMTAEQKQRAADLLAAWRATAYALHADRMAALLQELVDAQEALPATNPSQISSSAEPFGYFKAEPFGWTDCAETDDGAIALYTAPPAQSVPDGLHLLISGAVYDFAGFLTTREKTIQVGARVGADIVVDLLKEWAALRGLKLDDAAVLSWQEWLSPTPPEPPADVARDAERWQMLPAFLAEFQVPYLQLVDKIDAAIEREILGGGND